MKDQIELPGLRPLRLEPVFVERLWGAHSLEPWFAGAARDAAPIGEVWLTGNQCTFSAPALRGRSLGEVWRAMPAQWAGTGADTSQTFPLLVKFLFPQQKLSVQVHPSDQYARQYERAAGGRGKTEMWYVVEARPGAEVYVGLRPGVTPEVVRRKIRDGTVEECLNQIPIRAGEAIFVPAGTAHTIGPGSMLCEIQENSDLTFRLFDYGRTNPDGTTRQLHVEKALAVMNFGAQRGGIVAPACATVHGAEIAHFVACRYFAGERWKFEVPLDLSTEPEHFELWVVCAGRGRIWWGQDLPSESRFERYAPGQAFFLPAALGRWRIIPEEPTVFLHAYVPDLLRYAQQLEAQGVGQERIAEVVRYEPARE